MTAHPSADRQMMKRFRKFPALAVAAILMGHAGFGMAQFRGPPGGMGGGPPGDDRGGRAGPGGPVMASGAHLIADVEQQLDMLRKQLKLRPEQESLWLTYQERVGALVADQLRRPQASAADIGDALQQIGRKIDVVRNRLAAMEDISEAARQLYAKLDDEQRRVADRLLVATVPALYSGLNDAGPPDRNGGRGRPDRAGPPPN